MKYLLALVIALGINYSLLSPALAQVQCATFSIEYLIEVNKDKIVRIHVVEGEKFKTYLDNVNALRSKNKLWAIESKGMLIAEFKNGRLGTVLVDMNNCAVPGTLTSGSVAEFKEIFKEVESEALLDVIGTDS